MKLLILTSFLLVAEFLNGQVLNDLVGPLTTSEMKNLINVVPPTLVTNIGHKFKMREVVFKYNKITPLIRSSVFMKFIKNLSKDKELKDEFSILLVK